MAEAFRKAGLPDGVFNVVHGGPSAVDKLLAQPAVEAVSFVGSDAAGERVYEHARATRKRVQVECGGKNHGIILEDANATSTLYAIAGSAFGAAGQRCMSLSVAVFVGSTRHWIGQLVELARSLTVGCATDGNVSVGPLITPRAKKDVLEIINRAVEEGATVLLDGRDIIVPDYPDGNFLGPTILQDVQTYMECYQTEIFGPVLICMAVDTMDEAIELVNENRCKGVTSLHLILFLLNVAFFCRWQWMLDLHIIAAQRCCIPKQGQCRADWSQYPNRGPFRNVCPDKQQGIISWR